MFVAQIYAAYLFVLFFFKAEVSSEALIWSKVGVAMLPVSLCIW